jgi:hypothetical protein
MSFATRLLRILLIVALATSGPGMAMPQVTEKVVSTHAADSGCHAHAGMAHTTSRSDDGARGHTPHRDHCSSADCHCACGHLLQALSIPGALLPASPRRSVEILPSARLHPDAVLAHLIRPPIG